MRFRYDLRPVMQGDDDPINDDADGRDGDTQVITRTKPKLKKPSLYRVLLLNDDFTPMEFVVEVLARYFSMNLDQATQVMLHVHQNGVGECGVFTYEVAETHRTLPPRSDEHGASPASPDRGSSKNSAPAPQLQIPSA